MLKAVAEASNTMLARIVALSLILLGPSAAQLPGVTFSGVFSTSTPSNMCLDGPTLTKNLQLSGSIASKIRIYTISQCPQNTRIVLDYARMAGKTVFLGLWVSPNTEVNEQELQWLDDFASQYQDIIDAVVVGNEAVSVQKVMMMHPEFIYCRAMCLHEILLIGKQKN